MLEKIHLHNFKCFEDQEVPLGLLTVLSGLNGMGKSTVLQSLLLLRQSAEQGWVNSLKLNGKYVSLGNGQDVLYEKAVVEEGQIHEQIKIDYTECVVDCAEGVEKKHIEWKHSFEYVMDSGILPEENTITPEKIKQSIGMQSSVMLGSRFTYLSAYRINPRSVYGIMDKPQNEDPREFGNDGEFALQYLFEHGADDVSLQNVLRKGKPGARSGSLNDQVALWMDVISPGVSPRVQVDKMRRMALLGFEYLDGKIASGTYQSQNVGFGITYVLPIVVALLSAKEGDLIILENPEAHIHPYGQRMLGELIARVASNGVQIIMETHSDHILNGIRIMVKDKILPTQDVSIAYFYKDIEDDYRHKVTFPKILETGQLTEWPEGFFDEWENALIELL